MRDRIKIIYGAHLRDAKRRNIEFEFTFEEWVSWWEKQLGPDWLKKRGNIDGKFVMARKGDKGPYAASNVKCVTCNENNIERGVNKSTAHGEEHHRAKLTEAEVIEIRTTKHLDVKKYNVHYTSVLDARRGTTWSHLNSIIPPVTKRRGS